MKNYIIILICLSLLLCGCQAAGNNAGAEPTVAPTVAPTEEPTQEPTQEPTEPPLPAGAINVQPKWASTLKTYSKIPEYKTGYNRLSWSGLLHAADDVKTFLQDSFGEHTFFLDVDYAAYDVAFFEKNSVAVFLIEAGEDEWLLNFTGAERLANGDYSIGFEFYHGIGIPEHYERWFVIFVEMEGVTDNADVAFVLEKEDMSAGIRHVEHTPMTIYAWIREIAPGIRDSDMKGK